MEPDMDGSDLIIWALDPDTPRIRVATRRKDQDAAKLLYLGVYRLYRNGLGHRLREDIHNDEAFRVVSWIDHLLQMLEK